MHASLSLQLALYRRQKQQIRRAVESGSLAFRRYEARYRRRTRSFRRTLRASEVVARALASDVVYVGDYHTLRAAQRTYEQLATAALFAGRRVVLALEWAERKDQRTVDDFVRGRIGEDVFLARLGRPRARGFDLWVSFSRIFALARRHRLEVLAIDRRARGPRSLELRDDLAARLVARAAAAPDRPLVLVLAGQYHVAPCHLPALVEKALGGVKRRNLVVYQNCDDLYWRLAARGRAGVEAVELRPGEVCLFNASPVVCQQSFLDYLEAESGDAPLTEHGLGDRFRELARLVARFVGATRVSALSDVDVCSAADPDFLRRLARRGRLSRPELARVRRQVLERESYYFPEARLVYLASLSLNHAAEEAAHFVRHCCVGDAMAAPRRYEDAFYARILEEAIGFFGSRCVNPRRLCKSVPDWALVFRSARGADRRTAAFVLAHASAGPLAGAALPPRDDEALFHAVTHALGYLLGTALAEAHERGALRRPEIRSLFQDPFPAPREAYARLRERFGATERRAA